MKSNQRHVRQEQHVPVSDFNLLFLADENDEDTYHFSELTEEERLAKEKEEEEYDLELTPVLRDIPANLQVIEPQPRKLRLLKQDRVLAEQKMLQAAAKLKAMSRPFLNDE